MILILNMSFLDLNMPDTFFSWFLVTELHVWMIMVRYMAEGNAGKIVRNNLVATLWQDTNARVENLGVSNIILSVYYHLFFYTYYHSYFTDYSLLIIKYGNCRQSLKKLRISK